jgi:hypothetical protein
MNSGGVPGSRGRRGKVLGRRAGFKAGGGMPGQSVFDLEKRSVSRNAWGKQNGYSLAVREGFASQPAGFSVPPPNDLQADYYCLGIVLEELVGADAILCAIAQEVGRLWGLELQIIQLIENFALIDQDKRVLTPRDGWRVHAPMKKNHYNIWDASRMLKYATSMLFLCAVSTDSFRYVNTIGSCLARVCNEDNLDFLPYPYNRVPDKKD